MISESMSRLNFTSLLLICLMAPLLLCSSCRGSVASGNGQDKRDESPVSREEEVRFANGETILAGTLFRPADSVDYPAVVILAGSDRSKRGPLRIRIAKQFAIHNVAALVYDSPGTGKSTGNGLLQTRRERVTEALTALDYLRKRPGIRTTSVGLFGGSEGADIALLASARSPRVAFVIAVSGAAGVSILDVLRYSAEMRGYRQGLAPDEISKAITFKEIAFVFLSGIEIVEWPQIEARVQHWRDDAWITFIDISKQRNKKLGPEQRQAIMISFRRIIDHFKNEKWFSSVDVGSALQRIINLDVDNFFKLLEAGRYARDWDKNLCFVSKIRCPVLAIWGEEDSFLPPNQSAMRLRKALVESNHSDYEIKLFPDATHFLTVAGPGSEFAPGYIETMTRWLNDREGKNGNLKVNPNDGL
jgi:uncharacterized protein